MNFAAAATYKIAATATAAPCSSEKASSLKEEEQEQELVPVLGLGSGSAGSAGSANVAAGQEDTDLDTVIRICPFRVFRNFSTLLNYRVSCLHSSGASVAPLVFSARIGGGEGLHTHFLSRTLFRFGQEGEEQEPSPAQPDLRLRLGGTQHSSFCQIVFSEGLLGFRGG